MSQSEPPDVRQIHDNMAEARGIDNDREKSEEAKSAATPNKGMKLCDVCDGDNASVDVFQEESSERDNICAPIVEERLDGGHAKLKQQNSNESKKKRKKRKKKKGGAGGGEEEKGGGAQKRGSLPKEEINGNVVGKDVPQKAGDVTNFDTCETRKSKVAKKKSENGRKPSKGDEKENSDSNEKSGDIAENNVFENSEKSRNGVIKDTDNCEKGGNGDENENCENNEISQDDVQSKNCENSEKSLEIEDTAHTVHSGHNGALQDTHENKSSDIIENLLGSETNIETEDKDSPNESLPDCEHSKTEIATEEKDEGASPVNRVNEEIIQENKKDEDRADEPSMKCDMNDSNDQTSGADQVSSNTIDINEKPNGHSETDANLGTGGEVSGATQGDSTCDDLVSSNTDQVVETLHGHAETGANLGIGGEVSGAKHGESRGADLKSSNTDDVETLHGHAETEANLGIGGEVSGAKHGESRGADQESSNTDQIVETLRRHSETEANLGTGGEPPGAVQGESGGGDKPPQREKVADNFTEDADPHDFDKTGTSDKTCQLDDNQDRVSEESENMGEEPAKADNLEEKGFGVKEGAIGDERLEGEVVKAEMDGLDKKDAIDIKPCADTNSEISKSVDILDKMDSAVSCTTEKDNNNTKGEGEETFTGAKVKTTPNTLSHMTEDQLRKQNSDTLEAITRLQALAVEQKVQANLAMTSLRTKLRRRDNELKLIKSQHERQMLSVLSRLLYLEGHMQKEHKEIVEILQDKDDVIRRQKAAIDDLSQKNERLLQRLKETHGYAGDNGLTFPDTVIVSQSENISIQDHGNKVILRGNKLKNGEKITSKVRFHAMKERLKRHKSSLELYKSEPLETLVEGGIRYGSQENLVTQNGRPKDFDRKERCRSLMDYPYGLRDVYEHHNESPDSCFGDEYNSPDISHTDSVSSSTSSLVNIGERNGSAASRPGNRPMMSYGFNELSKSRSVPHALPTVSENDTGSMNLKERPLSLPSVELLAKSLAHGSAADASSDTSAKNSQPPLSTANPTTSQPSESSGAFKSFKNVFKRRGSKKKKSGTGIADGQDSNTETLKQHFKKYNLS